MKLNVLSICMICIEKLNLMYSTCISHQFLCEIKSQTQIVQRFILSIEFSQ